MGATHFLMKTLPRVASEMALHVLPYNLTRFCAPRTVCFNRNKRQLDRRLQKAYSLDQEAPQEYITDTLPVG
jgi:hypothetical protein